MLTQNSLFNSDVVKENEKPFIQNTTQSVQLENPHISSQIILCIRQNSEKF